MKITNTVSEKRNVHDFTIKIWRTTSIEPCGQ